MLIRSLALKQNATLFASETYASKGLHHLKKKSSGICFAPKEKGNIRILFFFNEINMSKQRLVLVTTSSRAAP